MISAGVEGEVGEEQGGFRSIDNVDCGIRYFFSPGSACFLFIRCANMAAISVYTIRTGDEAQSYVDVSLTYQRVGIEDHENGISYVDDWETPINAPQLP